MFVSSLKICGIFPSRHRVSGFGILKQGDQASYHAGQDADTQEYGEHILIHLFKGQNADHLHKGVFSVVFQKAEHTAVGVLFNKERESAGKCADRSDRR